MEDIINQLAQAGPDIEALRAARADARSNAQASFKALLEPENPGPFSYGERYAVAAFSAGVSQSSQAAEFYLDLLADETSPQVVDAVRRAIEHGVSSGPYKHGSFLVFSAADVGERLAAAFDWAHLLIFHPKDASPAAIGHLYSAGWAEDDTVSLSQLVAFLSFQLRVIHALSVLGGQSPSVPSASRVEGVTDPGWQVTDSVVYEEVVGPAGFVNHSLGWRPWVAPLSKEELTREQREALIQPQRIDSAYFRLLARDPAALKARTLTDFDIFYNTEGGLARADRELAATVVSRYNGCEYCASVHQARSVEEGGDRAAIDRLLFEGVEADLGSSKWDLIRRAALALTATPFAFGAKHVEELRAGGFDDQSILDLVYSASFFNWANRLMLTLGEAELPKRFRK
ncbi:MULTISPECIES: alkylhydroperoxidase domain protein [Corynebacterium]|uniref:alkylhydroperoxidase domain protein n=1 Tax=Corynebacterium TaxID=1716 RepID=UPI00257D249D|nr:MULTISPECIES: alkylhydroperoxidase domain protein [Corynebacterium]MDN6198787.1 alkylhydroperoxidase domain protein [Corynebacterium flavescens]